MSHRSMIFRVLLGLLFLIVAGSNVAMVNTYALGAPINFKVTALDPFNVTMTWEEGSTSEDGYSIERRSGTGAWQVLSPTINSNILTSGVKTLTTPLNSYSFRIRSYTGGVPTVPDAATGSTTVSPYSAEFPLTAAAYTMTSSTVAGETKVNLSWPNILNETGYQIQILFPGEFFYQQLILAPANSTTYQVISPLIEAGKTYSFKVRPYIGSNTIGESNVTTVNVDGITSKSGSSGVPGASFSHAFTHASDATVTSRSLTGIPTGLSFNTSNGVLSGIYPPLGVYTLNYTVNLSNGAILSQTFHIRVRPPAGPPVVGTVIPGWTSVAGSSRDSLLAGTFTDAEAESAVRVSTTLGDMDFILFNAATPATVTNFMSYVNAGKYSNVAFHRSIANFVIQSGGFQGTEIGSNFNSVVTNPPVTNEPGITNYRGTISMAKVGGNPNSATSQFFVSLKENSANLDYQNGGFTVFGRVAGNGMTVADAMSHLPNSTYNLLLNGSSTPTSFTNFPMNAATAPVTMDQTKVVKINSVNTIPTLSYSVTGNTNPAVASASIVSGNLRIIGLSGGQTTLIVTATDLDLLATSQNVSVNLTDTFSSWAAGTTFPNGQNGILQNPDHDSLTNLQEYAFFGDPGISSQAQVPVAGVSGLAPAARYMTLDFPVRKFTTGLSYVVESNNQLTGAWTQVWSSSDGFSHAQVMGAINQADRTQVTIKDTVVLGAQEKRFMRVKVVQD